MKKGLFISAVSASVLMFNAFWPSSVPSKAYASDNNEVILVQKDVTSQYKNFINLLSSSLENENLETQAIILADLSETLKKFNDKDVQETDLGELNVSSIDEQIASVKNDGVKHQIEIGELAEKEELEDSYSTEFDIPQMSELSNVYLYDSGLKEYKQLTHEEAMAHNPLHLVNTKRNTLIFDAITKENEGHEDPWLEYRKFEYKQAPYNFEIINGKPEYNKFYYGKLIESTVSVIKDAEAEGDREKVDVWKENFQERLLQFKNAPGVVPYVVGLNHTLDIAVENGVSQCDLTIWEDPESLWKNQGKMWWENALFEDYPELLDQAIFSSYKYGTDMNNVNRNAN